MGLVGNGPFALLTKARMKDPVEGTAQVVNRELWSSQGSSVFVMDCVVSAPGVEPVAVHKTMITALGKLPDPGQTIPIIVDRTKPKRFVIVWKKIPKWKDVERQQAQSLASGMRQGEAGFGVPGVVVGDAGQMADLQQQLARFQSLMQQQGVHIMQQPPEKREAVARDLQAAGIAGADAEGLCQSPTRRSSRPLSTSSSNTG